MDVEIEHPHHHHATGYRWLDKVLPISALFVSLISILIAFHHGQVMQNLVTQNERLVQANSLPYLTFETTADFSAPGSRNVQLSVSNKGVGPAGIRWTEYTMGGRPIKDISMAVTGTGAKVMRLASLNNTMLRPGETSNFAEFSEAKNGNAPPSKFVDAMLNDLIVTKVCYCSVFEECWTAASIGGQPTKVDNCPVQQSAGGSN